MERDKKKSGSTGAQKITCPVCGNETEFLEVADDVVLTSRFLQNPDGSFIEDGDDSQVLGEIKFICGECHADLSNFHQRFLDMLF